MVIASSCLGCGSSELSSLGIGCMGEGLGYWGVWDKDGDVIGSLANDVACGVDRNVFGYLWFD